MKRKLIPDPRLAEVTDWPYSVEGQVDIIDGGWSTDVPTPENADKSEFLASFAAAAHLCLADGHKIVFHLKGHALVPEMIWPEEFDGESLFRVSLELSDSEGIPTAVDGKLVYLQDYQAVAVARVSS